MKQIKLFDELSLLEGTVSKTNEDVEIKFNLIGTFILKNLLMSL